MATVQIIRRNADWLTKRISHTGILSRRRAEMAIENGEIKMNGQVVKKNTFLYDEKNITYKDQPISLQSTTSLWGIHKPRGVICTLDKRNGITTLKDFITKMLELNAIYLPTHFFVLKGLPANAEGLVILCNNGDLANQINLQEPALENTLELRVHGRIHNDILENLRRSQLLSKQVREKFQIKMIRQRWNSAWLQVKTIDPQLLNLHKIFSRENLQIIRLRRIAFGPYNLSQLSKRSIIPLKTKISNTNTKINPESIKEISQKLGRRVLSTRKAEPQNSEQKSITEDPIKKKISQDPFLSIDLFEKYKQNF